MPMLSINELTFFLEYGNIDFPNQTTLFISSYRISNTDIEGSTTRQPSYIYNECENNETKIENTNKTLNLITPIVKGEDNEQ